MVIIKGLQKTSLIEYPERMSCVVFLAGCNFSCPFCHNPLLVKGFESLPTVDEKYFFTFLERRKKWLDGVCITGGEPTVYDDLPEFIREIKKLDFLVKLDTNGTNPKMMNLLLKENLLDYIAMDIKSTMKKYSVAAGKNTDTAKIQKSIRTIINSGIDHEFRSTVLPRLHTRDDIIDIARSIKGAKMFYLQKFRNIDTLEPEFRNETSFTDKKMIEIAKECSNHVPTEARI